MCEGRRDERRKLFLQQVVLNILHEKVVFLKTKRAMNHCAIKISRSCSLLKEMNQLCNRSVVHQYKNRCLKAYKS